MTKPHEGMPAFDQSGEPLSFFEFWPMWAFYPPVMLYALYLMLRYRGILLPTVANPSFPGGGFVGESKADILALATKHTRMGGRFFCDHSPSSDRCSRVQSIQARRALWHGAKGL